MRHLLDQMELTFEECETTASEDERLDALAAATTNVAPFERKRPARKPLPEHLPCEGVGRGHGLDTQGMDRFRRLPR